CLLSPSDSQGRDCELPTEKRCREYVGWAKCCNIRRSLDLRIQIDRKIRHSPRRKSDCPRCSDIAAAGDRGVQIKRAPRQAGLQRCSCQTAKRARKPEADAALVRSGWS